MSGEWFGEIPQHWESEKIGALFAERRMKVSDKDYPPLSVAKIGVVPQLETAVKTDAGDNRKLVCAGDFVINSRSDRKGSCGVSILDGSVSLINIVLTPRGQLSGGYTHYLLRSQPFAEEYYRNGRGIVSDLWTTRYSEMKSIMLPIPPSDEQKQIVRFLDWKVSAINRMINLRHKEITALEDLKRSIIHHAVTHGIKPNVPMKDSGVQWIGKIPVHWKISRIKNELDNLDYLREPVSAENRDNRLGLYDYYGASGIIDKIDSYNVDDTVLLIGEDGANLVLRHLPLVYKASGKFWVNNHAHILKVHANNDYDFFAYLLEAGDYSIYITGSAQPKLTQTNLMSFQIPLPHIDEQIVIADFLNKKCAAINELAKVKNKYLEKLQDLRARLISDVVTGKIDVRGVEVPEFAPVEEEVGTDMNEEEVSE